MRADPKHGPAIATVVARCLYSLVGLMATGATVSAEATRWSECDPASPASLATPPTPPDTPQEQEYAPLRGFDREVDLGIGHLYAADRFDWDWTIGLTLPLFERPEAPPLAWLLDGWVVPSDGQPRPLGSSGLVETGYEIPSFIVFEARPDGWVRLRFAPGDSGIAWTHSCFFDQAWGRVEVEPWEARLTSSEISPLYFRARVPHALRRGPSETSERLRWVSAGGTSVLRPLEIIGDWMRVELSQPSDYCEEPDDPPVEKTEGWVRWRDGSPWVWYYTRGC